MQAEEFYAEHTDKPFFEALVQFMCSGPLVALALYKSTAIMDWRALAGPTNSLTAKEAAPGSLRAQFGTDGTRNAVHGSDSTAAAARELAFHFGPLQTTLAMVKPDAVAAGHADAIVGAAVQAKLVPVARTRTTLTRAQAEAFYAEHADKPFFAGLVDFMCSGPVEAIAFSGRGAVGVWRGLCGPTNTAAAKAEAPTSLRALFGTDGTRNAVHGSDGEPAAAREAAVFFPGGVPAPPAAGFTLPAVSPL